MKKSTKIFSCILAVCAVISCASAFGTSLAKQIDIYYRNIKINVNGTEITPKNADGEVVEPFIYDGTTYLPVRAVAQALDKDVSWDDATSTVKITDKGTASSDNESKEETESKPASDTNLNLTNSNAKYNTKISDRIAKDVEKTKEDDNYLLTVNGVPFSEAALKYAVTACTAYYDGKSDSDTEKAVFDEIDKYFRTNAAVISFANEMGIELTEEEYGNLVTDMFSSLKAYYGDDLYTIIEQYTSQTPHYYFLNSCYNELYMKLLAAFEKDPIFAAVIKEKTLSKMTTQEAPYVRAKHILVCFPEGEYAPTEEQKAPVLAKANEIYEKVKNGEDFDALVKEYGEDPGMETYPHGYYFTYGEMVEPFEKTAFSLKEGEFSEPVETNFGYHIILRLPLDEDEAIKSTEMYTNIAFEVISDKLESASSDYKVVYTDDFNKIYDGYRKSAIEAYN